MRFFTYGVIGAVFLTLIHPDLAIEGAIPASFFIVLVGWCANQVW